MSNSYVYEIMLHKKIADEISLTVSTYRQKEMGDICRRMCWIYRKQCSTCIVYPSYVYSRHARKPETGKKWIDDSQKQQKMTDLSLWLRIVNRNIIASDTGNFINWTH